MREVRDPREAEHLRHQVVVLGAALNCVEMIVAMLTKLWKARLARPPAEQAEVDVIVHSCYREGSRAQPGRCARVSQACVSTAEVGALTL